MSLKRGGECTAGWPGVVSVHRLAHRGSRVRYENVFTPIRIGPVEVANRIYVPPHGVRMEVMATTAATFMPSDSYANYLAERAAGGVGLLFHSTQVHPIARQAYLGATPWLPEAVPSYAAVADAVHGEGAKIMAQLWYASFLDKLWEDLGPFRPNLSASATERPDGLGFFYAIPKDGIELFIAAHRQSTRHLRVAGYDGIELNAAHGCLIEHFLSPYFNNRTDEYGGSFENRVRLLVQLLEAVREEAGESMAVGFRINASELIDGGYDEEDCKQILTYVAGTGLADFVDIDISLEPMQLDMMTPQFTFPKHHNRERAAKVSPAAAPMVTLAAPGRLNDIADAEEMIAAGVADMMGIVRGHVAEPELVRHAQEGREHESRRCLAINFCAGGANGLGCAINPATGREGKWGVRTFTPPPRLLKVVVVGGGPGGMEAARVAGKRGHQVVLLERNHQLGGALLMWAQMPGREHLAGAPEWWARQLSQLEQVQVVTGHIATLETVLAHGPDVAIVATGSVYSREGTRGGGTSAAPTPGWDRDFVLTPEEVLNGTATVEGNVVVFDGDGMTGSGIAELLARKGHHVELVTAAPGLKVISTGLSGTGGASILPRLIAAGVAMTSGEITEIGDHSVTFSEPSGSRTVDDVGTVVLATRREMLSSLAAELEGRTEALYLIGDALSPRGLPDASYEGARFARLIGEPDMAKSTVEEMFRPQDPVVAAGRTAL
jgi:2,4-dienoyl-CoA reductase-like NADH-dependent reductase (Old Yellow Enzyme family)